MPTPRGFVPRPRRHGIVAQEVDGETLLYVEETHQASCLNGPAARIWALCDGGRTLEAISTEAQMAPDVVERAIRELGEAGLLDNVDELPPSFNRSRRRMLVAGLAALPVILLVTAPRAAHAGSPCTPNGAECNINTPPCCNNTPCPPAGGTC